MVFLVAACMDDAGLPFTLVSVLLLSQTHTFLSGFEVAVGSAFTPVTGIAATTIAETISSAPIVFRICLLNFLFFFFATFVIEKPKPFFYCAFRNCSVLSQSRCKIHSKSASPMGFCITESFSYGLGSKCFDLY